MSATANLQELVGLNPAKAWCRRALDEVHRALSEARSRAQRLRREAKERLHHRHRLRMLQQSAVIKLLGYFSIYFS